jgi:hypothetical protein
MKELFTEQPLIFSGIILTILAGTALQILVGIDLARMLQESSTMEESSPRLFRQWLESFLKEEKNITNIDIFVDKSLQEFRLGQFTLIQMKHLSEQLLLLSVFLSGLGACRGIIAGNTLGQILPFYIICIFGLYLHFSLSGVIDMEEKLKRIKVNLIDFLENHKPFLCGQTETEKEEKQIEDPVIIFSEEAERELQELLREILA